MRGSADPVDGSISTYRKAADASGKSPEMPSAWQAYQDNFVLAERLLCALQAQLSSLNKLPSLVAFGAALPCVGAVAIKSVRVDTIADEVTRAHHTQ